jgi:hypothetical protein
MTTSAFQTLSELLDANYDPEYRELIKDTWAGYGERPEFMPTPAAIEHAVREYSALPKGLRDVRRFPSTAENQARVEELRAFQRRVLEDLTAATPLGVVWEKIAAAAVNSHPCGEILGGQDRSEWAITSRSIKGSGVYCFRHWVLRRGLQGWRVKHAVSTARI